MLLIRKAEDIYQVDGRILNGTFHGRWHFSFGNYYDPRFNNFGTLRVFNDDTLSPCAIWPLHPHRDNEVVTYCAGGEFMHEDEHGVGGILKKGWVQHTTVGTGMWHSELNNRPDEPMRFIQMWFKPKTKGAKPSVEQKKVDTDDRTNRFLSLVSNTDEYALKILSDAKVFSSYLEQGNTLTLEIPRGWGAYVYLLEKGPILVQGERVESFESAMITEMDSVTVKAEADAEVLAVLARTGN